MSSFLLSLVWALSFIFTVGNASPLSAHSTTPPSGSPEDALSCFPAVGFQMPSSVPSSTDGWWCEPSTEYAFLGFSYEITACE